MCVLYACFWMMIGFSVWGGEGGGGLLSTGAVVIWRVLSPVQVLDKWVTSLPETTVLVMEGRRAETDLQTTSTGR